MFINNKKKFVSLIMFIVCLLIVFFLSIKMVNKYKEPEEIPVATKIVSPNLEISVKVPGYFSSTCSWVGGGGSWETKVRKKIKSRVIFVNVNGEFKKNLVRDETGEHTIIVSYNFFNSNNSIDCYDIFGKRYVGKFSKNDIESYMVSVDSLLY